MAPQNTPPPPAKNMSQMQYFLQLTQQGYPTEAAYSSTMQYFGPQQQAQKQSNAALGQTAGQIIGLGGAAWAKNGFKLPSWLGGGASEAGTAGEAGAAGTAGAAAAAPAGMTAVGTAADGSIMYAPASMAGAEAGTAGAEGLTLAGVGEVALPLAAIAAGASTLWEDGMKDIVRGKGNRADYTNLGVDLASGGLINLGLRLAGKRSIGKQMSTGKSDAQLLRDDFRGKLKDTGVADKDYNVVLANGDKFNVGLDGKTKYTNIDGKTKRNAWDVDYSNSLAKYASEQVDPMIRRIYGPDAEKKGIKPEQYTGMIVNAVTSNAKSQDDVMKNIHSVFGKSEFAQQGGMGSNVTPNKGAPINSKGGKIRDNLNLYYFK